MKLVLHIGTEKTGTTTIQHFLQINRAALLDKGVLVPQALGWGNHWHLPALFAESNNLQDLFRNVGLNSMVAQREAISNWYRLFEQEYHISSAERMIVSSEHLQSRLRTETELQALKQFLDPYFTSVEVVLYLRDPLETAISMLSTAVKWGGNSAEPLQPQNPYLRHVTDHRQTIEQWSKVFGEQALRVRIFERNALRDADLISDFVEAASMPNLQYQNPKKLNEKLSWFGLAVFARVNKLGADNPNRVVQGQERKEIIAFFERYFADGPRFCPEPELEQSFSNFFTNSNDWVRQRFFPDRDQLFQPRHGVQEHRIPPTPETVEATSQALWRLWLENHWKESKGQE